MKSEPCPICKKPFHERRKKILNGYKIKHGQRGRPRKRPDDTIIMSLRKKGLSLRKIAKELNIAPSTVYYALKKERSEADE